MTYLQQRLFPQTDLTGNVSDRALGLTARDVVGERSKRNLVELSHTSFVAIEQAEVGELERRVFYRVDEDPTMVVATAFECAGGDRHRGDGSRRVAGRSGA